VLHQETRVDSYKYTGAEVAEQAKELSYAIIVVQGGLLRKSTRA